MKNMRGLMIIVLSLAAGIAAVMLAGRWLNAKTAVATNKVAVASVDVGVGEIIKTEKFRLIDWPLGSVPKGAYSNPAEVEGRVAKSAISRDEPILDSKLAPLGSKGGLSAVIAQGKRAITVRVNDVVGVAGFALPGNLVDVIVSTRRGENAAQETSVSKIVLERILVLAVAQEASLDDTKPKVVNAVTLEVTPDEAEKLDLARSVGSLSLVLRNQIDKQNASTEGATKNSLLGIVSKPAAVRVAARPAPAPAVPAAPAPPARVCVDALVGANRTTECF